MAESITLGEARDALYKFVCPSDANDPSFVAALNQVLDRIYNSGKWKRTEETVSVEVPDDGYIALPERYESVVAAAKDGRPVEVWSGEAEFNPGGPGFSDDPATCSFRGLVDKGFSTDGTTGSWTNVLEYWEEDYH